MGPSALPAVTVDPASLARLRRRYQRRHPLPRLWRRADFSFAFRQLVSLLSVLSLLWSSTSVLWVPDLAEAQNLTQQATLTVLSPTVEVQRTTGAREDATSGMTVNVGDRIITGPTGRAQLTFLQGAEVEIGENAEIMVQQSEQRAGGATTVGIGQAIGNTISRVASLFNPASRFQVNTPSAVAVVRGTDLGVGVNAFRIQVFTCSNTSGTCDITSGGQTVQLKQGESTFILPPPPQPTGAPSRDEVKDQREQQGDNQGLGDGIGGGRDQAPAARIPSGQLDAALRVAVATFAATLGPNTTVLVVTTTPGAGFGTGTPIAGLPSPTPLPRSRHTVVHAGRLRHTAAVLDAHPAAPHHPLPRRPPHHHLRNSHRPPWTRHRRP